AKLGALRPPSARRVAASYLRPWRARPLASWTAARDHHRSKPVPPSSVRAWLSWVSDPSDAAVSGFALSLLYFIIGSEVAPSPRELSPDAEISAANLATTGHAPGGWPGALSPVITKSII